MWLKSLVCRLIGHKWRTYANQTGYYSYNVEQAGYCVSQTHAYGGFYGDTSDLSA